MYGLLHDYSMRKWRFIIAVALILLAGVGGFAAGYKWMAAKYYEEKAETAEVVAKLVEAGSKVTVKYETIYIDRVKKVYVRGADRVREVPVYVTKDDDAACELRNGFVRLYDSSLSGTAPGPAADTDRNPSGIALSRAAEGAILRNNTELLACRERLEGWQKFYEELKQKYNP